jgi:cytochrome c peroxidase
MGVAGPKVSMAAGMLAACWGAPFACSSSPTAASGDVARGDTDFHDRVLAGLGGNGRACSDCHVDASAFQLSPASAEARFEQMTTSGIDDPLFRPVDADDFVTNGPSATAYGHLRERGLIRIRMKLPANMKVVDPASCLTDGAAAPCQTATAYSVSTATFTDVWRSVPSVLNVGVTGAAASSTPWPRGPNPQGGYQLDARVDTLQDQAQGALVNHAEVAVAPPAAMLDDIAAYETGLVADAEPPPSALETTGKAVFERACGQCHNGPGMNTPITAPQTVLRFADDLTDCPLPVDAASPARWDLPACAPALALDEQTYEITFDDGFKLRKTTTDPGRALLSGFVFSGPPDSDGACAHAPCGLPQHDDWQKLDVPSLRGISKTAPYFHNNSAATLEDVVIHYEEFFKNVSALDPPPDLPPLLTTDNVNRDRPNVPSERAALVAYLMKL